MSLPPELDALGERLHAATVRSLRRRRLVRASATSLALVLAGFAGVMVASPPGGTIAAQPATVAVVAGPALAATSGDLQLVPAADRRTHPCGRPRSATVQACGPHAFTSDLRPY